MAIAAPDDDSLLAAWRAGDRVAGEALFERYYDAIERFFVNKVRDSSDDLVQQTFEACVQGRDRLQNTSSFRSYLFAIAHNLLRSHFRQVRREAEHVDFTMRSAFDLSPGPSTWVAHRRERQILLDALRRIPLDFQVVLELRIWEEMRTAEIAEVMDIPHGTARSRLRRGRQLLLEAVEAARRDGERELGELESFARGLEDPPDPPDPPDPSSD
jgi:RNA polymerase sigma-70 factor (ECF subfamily)